MVVSNEEITMLVTFSSKAGADILMLGEHAKPLLRIAGKIIETPFPARGVFAADQLPDAIGRLERAIDADRAPAPSPDDDDAGDHENRIGVSLRQRAFPLLDLMRRAQKSGHPVLWEAGSGW